jgi:hypothetical protein
VDQGLGLSSLVGTSILKHVASALESAVRRLAGWLKLDEISRLQVSTTIREVEEERVTAAGENVEAGLMFSVLRGTPSAMIFVPTATERLLALRHGPINGLPAVLRFEEHIAGRDSVE